MEHKLKDSDFTRKRKLTVSSVFSMVLSMIGNNALKGISSKSMDFIRLSKILKLDLGIDSIDKSAISRARKKISFEVFRDVFYQGVKIAHELFPKSEAYTWKGFSVYAVDGSKYTLPASDELRERFDKKSGFENAGKGHYPQCLVTTIYDVYRKIPIARSVSKANSSERAEFLKLLNSTPDYQSLFVFDRGYPSFEMFNGLLMANKKFLFRCPTSHTFKQVEEFLKTGERDGFIELEKLVGNGIKNKITLRIIVTYNPKGEQIVLLTNLLDTKKYTLKELIKLYFARWEVEINYRNEKTSIKVENFHSKSYNGVMQELYAVCILNLITRLSVATVVSEKNTLKKEPQYKNAIITFARNMAIFATKKIKRCIKIFIQIIEDILCVNYYKENKKNKSQPRVVKRAISKWYENRKILLQIP